ncbi:MAG: hypothetical protein C0507_07570 [Cyanobacteria bacterium PR.3.49]|nr:hypothetical protein [Cyanobacteria bacterium PR.3.49]
MRTEFKPHEPPNSAEIEQMWRELNIQPIKINAPSVTKVVDLLRLIFIKGSVEFACFQIDRHPALEWFASRSRILPDDSPADIDFFGRFLTLPATRAALPMMRIGEHLSAELELEWISPFTHR